ncbi:transcriptional regulator, AraC family domain protein [Burkholderia pseudomallei MSHR5596]|nr:transcriptional regulator, AraC family domain protein [Burkholderia pseudomallei MSHR5596]
MTAKLAHWDFVRPVATTRVLVDVGVEQGLAVGQCLGGSGVCADLLDKPDAPPSPPRRNCASFAI